MNQEVVHTSDVVYFDDDHLETPAEVCVECSDWLLGRWVPVLFCVYQPVDMAG